MIITDGYPRFDKTDTNDKNKMKPAFEQMLSCIRQHSLTYNEAKAVFRALENAMPAIMVIPKKLLTALLLNSLATWRRTGSDADFKLLMRSAMAESRISLTIS